MQLLLPRAQHKTTAVVCCKVLLVILLSHSITVTAELTCHHCRGINCLRSSHQATQKCLNDLDTCVNVYDGQTVQAQGCWQQLPEQLRLKCESDEPSLDWKVLKECFKCNENLCNNFSAKSFECLQCDSDRDDDCRSKPDSLQPSKCSISRTQNAYCFTKQEDGGRVIRGCSNTLAEQVTCLNSDSCTLCQPSEVTNCNNQQATVDNSDSNEEHKEDNDVGSGEQRLCHQCSGINCLRTSLRTFQKCENPADICATVFEGQTVLAQGCWEQLSAEVRSKCDSATQCSKCNANMCNDLASISFECIQCDSDADANCRTDPLSLAPLQCGVARTPNQYCFARQKGDHVTRGCVYTLEEQVSCLESDDCFVCQPSEISGCNSIKVLQDPSTPSGNDSNDQVTDAANAGNDESENGSDGDDSEQGSWSSTTNSGQVSTESEAEVEKPHDNNHEEGSSGDGSNGCSSNLFNTFVSLNIIMVFVIKYTL